MKNFIITTDSTADLPVDYVNEHQLRIMSLPYTIDGTTYTWENPMEVTEFYRLMREGSLPTTSQANPQEAAELFEQKRTGC